MIEICEGCHRRTTRLRNERCRDCYRWLAHLREFLAAWCCHIRYRYLPAWITPAALDERLNQEHTAGYIQGLTAARERDEPVPPSIEVRRHAERTTGTGRRLVALS
jgi:hypothetical protein